MPATAVTQQPPPEQLNALPVGTRLGEFEIRAVLGVGGFGIVYKAFDHALEREVAIKEYMPGALAARSATLQVSVLSQNHAETFSIGLKSFVNEARLLARFDHPALVKAHRFWEANGTGYMVMPFYRGRTLKTLRRSMDAPPSENWMLRLLEPLLGALETLHAQGVYHRDVSPDNILVGDDGRPVLLDFGAARRVLGDQTQALTAILKPHFAPVEQYGETQGLRQGPWTDLYSLGATLYFAITGSPPQPATARALGSGAQSLADERRPGLTMDFLRAVDWMMAPRPEHRPQSVAELREVLLGHNAAPIVTAPAPLTEESSTSWEHTVVRDPAADPVIPDMAALLAMRAEASDSDLRRRFADQPPSERWRREQRRRGQRRRVAWLSALLVAVAGGAAVWQYGSDGLLASAFPSATGHSAPAPPQLTAPAPSPAAVSTQAAPVAALPAADPASTAAVLTTPTAEPAAAASTHPATEAVGGPPSAAQVRALDVHVPTRGEPVTQPAPRAARAARSDPAAPPVQDTATDAAGQPALAAVGSPREQCRGRLALAWYRCIKRACQAQPTAADTHECQRVRQIEADNQVGQRAGSTR
jgi:serine/threonine protein kinase